LLTSIGAAIAAITLTGAGLPHAQGTDENPPTVQDTEKATCEVTVGAAEGTDNLGGIASAYGKDITVETLIASNEDIDDAESFLTSGQIVIVPADCSPRDRPKSAGPGDLVLGSSGTGTLAEDESEDAELNVDEVNGKPTSVETPPPGEQLIATATAVPPSATAVPATATAVPASAIPTALPTTPEPAAEAATEDEGTFNSIPLDAPELDESDSGRGGWYRWFVIPAVLAALLVAAFSMRKRPEPMTQTTQPLGAPDVPVAHDTIDATHPVSVGAASTSATPPAAGEVVAPPPAVSPAQASDPTPSPSAPAAAPRAAARPDLLVLGEPSRSAGGSAQYAPKVGMFVPALMADEGELGAVTFRAGSVQGDSHRHGGEPRQDSYAVAASTDADWFVAAVADGLGSLALSHFASAEAATFVCDFLCSALADEEISAGNAMHEVDRRLRERFADHLDQMATTLVALVVHIETGESHAIRVGDSKILRRVSAQWDEVFKADEDGSDLGASTAVLPGNPESSETRAFTMTAGDLILLATDGIADPILASPSVVGEGFLDQLSEPPSLSDFVRLVRFDRRGAFDDRTAVALWWTGPGTDVG